MRFGGFAVALGLICAGVAAAQPATVIAQSESVVAEKASFYADVRTKRYDAAVVVGGVAHRRDPDDERFALDYAYALLAAHHPAQATALLEHLKSSRIATVAAAAKRQLAAQAPPPSANGAVLPPVSSASPPPFTDAYELLAGGDLVASRDAFLKTLKDHPDDASAWRQVSYIDFILKDGPGMLAALDKYIALMPNDDKAKLERAYAELGAKNFTEAHKELTALLTSSDPEVAAAAKTQIAAGFGTGGRPTHVDAFGYALNDSRFHDTFYGLDARYFLAQTRVQPYIALHFTNDAKASSVPASEILNDNVLIVEPGLRTKISPIAYAFVEGGAAESLLTGHIQTDLRYGLLLSTRLGTGGRKPQTQFDASLTHYSRYINTIFYANIAHDFYIGNKFVRGVVGTNIALDTSREFYNNAAEGFAGLQVRSGVFTFRIIGTAGEYLPRGGDLPFGRTYSSIRPELLFGYSH